MLNKYTFFLLFIFFTQSCTNNDICPSNVENMTCDKAKIFHFTADNNSKKVSKDWQLEVTSLLPEKGLHLRVAECPKAHTGPKDLVLFYDPQADKYHVEKFIIPNAQGVNPILIENTSDTNFSYKATYIGDKEEKFSVTNGKEFLAPATTQQSNAKNNTVVSFASTVSTGSEMVYPRALEDKEFLHCYLPLIEKQRKEIGEKVKSTIEVVLKDDPCTSCINLSEAFFSEQDKCTEILAKMASKSCIKWVEEYRQKSFFPRNTPSQIFDPIAKFFCSKIIPTNSFKQACASANHEAIKEIIGEMSVDQKNFCCEFVCQKEAKQCQ